MYNMLIFLIGLLTKYRENAGSIIYNPSDIWPIVLTYRFENHLVIIHCRHTLEYLSVHVIKGRYQSRKIYELKPNELLGFLEKYKGKNEEVEAA